MKKKVIIPIFLVLIILQGTACAQWTQSFDCNKPLNKVFTLNLNHAYAVGSDGVFFQTSDGGYSWQEFSTTTTKQLFDVQFLDPMKGFICGETGTLLKTNDGGTTWNACNTNTILNLSSICFLNSDTGWVSGTSNPISYPEPSDTGIILRTMDGGQNFIICKGFNSGIQQIAAFNFDTCLAISIGNENSIWKSTNAGNTWGISHNENIGEPLTSIKCLPSGEALISCLEYQLYRTFDYGFTWDSVRYDSSTIQSVLNISAPSSNHIYTAGYLPQIGWGSIFSTNNGGLNWNLEEGGQYGPYFRDLDFANDSIGFAITANGIIYKRGVIDGIYGNDPRFLHCKIYPNPSTSNLHINLSDFGQNFNNPILATIYSLQGVTEIEKQVSSARFTIDVGQLPPGIYFLSINDKSKSLNFTKYIIKK